MRCTTHLNLSVMVLTSLACAAPFTVETSRPTIILERRDPSFTVEKRDFTVERSFRVERDPSAKVVERFTVETTPSLAERFTVESEPTGVEARRDPGFTVERRDFTVKKLASVGKAVRTPELAERFMVEATLATDAVAPNFTVEKRGFTVETHKRGIIFEAAPTVGTGKRGFTVEMAPTLTA